MALADSYDGRDAQGHYSNPLDAFLAIGCIDGSRTVPADPARSTSRRRSWPRRRPYQTTGDPPRGIHDPCAFWPAPPADGHR